MTFCSFPEADGREGDWRKRKTEDLHKRIWKSFPVSVQKQTVAAVSDLSRESDKDHPGACRQNPGTRSLRAVRRQSQPLQWALEWTCH